VLVAAGVLGIVSALALFVWRDDILKALLDPGVPFAVYTPPPAPNYRQDRAWALLPRAGQDARRAAVFFLGPTTFEGGRNWNGPIDDPGSRALFNRMAAPNYAAPFAASGEVFAPLYRQASLYANTTLFDDALEAREFAYRDVRAAFDAFLLRVGPDRPLLIVGVEQGGVLASRLLTEVVAPSPWLRPRLVAAYLIETPDPAAQGEKVRAIAPCQSRGESGCVIAFVSTPRLDFARVARVLARAKVWDAKGRLVSLDGRRLVCVNPLLGAETTKEAPARDNLGAVNATGLEWGARPAFLPRQVGAVCRDGLLHVDPPRSATLRPSGGLLERMRVASFNLFWGDLEADARTRLAVWSNGRGR
jgi:hypothetical protein